MDSDANQREVKAQQVGAGRAGVGGVGERDEALAGVVQQLEGAVARLGDAVAIEQAPRAGRTERHRGEALLLEDVGERPPRQRVQHTLRSQSDDMR